MRIAFTGASGTGKSELAKWLAETTFAKPPIANLPYNPIGSRSVAKDMGFDSPYDVDKHGLRTEFQEKLLAAKIAWESEHERFVTDRTTIDNLVYAIMHNASGVTPAYVRDARAWVERYDIIFACPVSAFCNVAGDPQRVASRTYHEIYDRILTSYFYGEKRVVPLTMQDLDIRKRVVFNALVQLYKYGILKDRKAVYDL